MDYEKEIKELQEEVKLLKRKMFLNTDENFLKKTTWITLGMLSVSLVITLISFLN